MSKIRNIAIIAHVDHGKTTLVDGLLKQTHVFRDNQAEMAQTTILDSNDLERERGITILAKNTAVQYGDYKINIIDTPGHADFGGEVERVISMADGALLLVDAAKGPLPQTKFVLGQALKLRLPVIVIINKIDRKDAEPAQILQQIEELFLQLANDVSTLDFPVLYAVGREGKAWTELPHDPSTAMGDLQPIFEQIIKTVPAPQVKKADLPFKMQVSHLDFDSYKGIYAIGKVYQGIVHAGDTLSILAEDQVISKAKVDQVFSSEGLDRVAVSQSIPGDIVALTGFDQIKIGQTLADSTDLTGFPMIQLSEPTLKIQMNVNTSPFLGKEGRFCTIRQIRERLEKETRTNIGLQVEKNDHGGLTIAGRGELHLAILIETMRREGYEFELGRPQVIFKTIDDQVCEPVEELMIEIEKEYLGVISEQLSRRQALLLDTRTNEKGITKLVYEISSRNLLGFRSQILTKTKGNGIFTSQFKKYAPLGKPNSIVRNGALVATESGVVASYALESIQKRGVTFVPPGTEVYQGMIVGVSKQPTDLDVNICKTKKLTNFRSNADIAVPLDPPLQMSLEQCLAFLNDDELLEVTPQNLRLRKKILDKQQRYKKSSINLHSTSQIE